MIRIGAPNSLPALLARVCLVLAFLGCAELTVPPELSDEADAYLEHALNLMEEHSINRYKIEWTPFRQRARLFAVGAQTTAETYDAIRYAVYQLGDNHSVFRPPPEGQSTLLQLRSSEAPPDPYGQLLDGRIGYLRLFGFSGSDRVQHADTIQGLIRGLDGTGVCGWILDLRENTGGDMWPMLAGVGPILGEGVVGAFVTPDSIWTRWVYEAGAARIDQHVYLTVSGTPYVPIEPNPNVAVLTGAVTASSGEAIVVAFRGRPKAMSFGQGTYGVSTGNRPFTLSDGALLAITTSTFVDRTGRIYGGVIEPDEFVEGDVADDPTSGDAVVDAALAWLTSRVACGGQQ